MKYIRTKAGEIYDIDELYICDELNDKPYGVKNSSWVIYKESIINQADTIKELCDDYVIKNPENNRHHFARYESLYELQTIAKEHTDLEIYGAIWTDKGLIYVAKMNEEGELKLL